MDEIKGIIQEHYGDDKRYSYYEMKGDVGGVMNQIRIFHKIMNPTLLEAMTIGLIADDLLRGYRLVLEMNSEPRYLILNYSEFDPKSRPLSDLDGIIDNI